MRSTSEQYTCYNASQSPPTVIAIVIAPHRLSDWLSIGINSSKCIAVYFLLLREDGSSPLEGLTCSVVRGNNRCLFCDSYETHKYTVWVNAKVCFMLQYTKALFNVVLFIAFMFVRSLPIYTSKFTSFHFRFNILWPVYFHLFDLFFTGI
jgi:hypothetical protein